MDRFRRDVDRTREIFAQCDIEVNQGPLTVIQDPSLLDHPDWDCVSGRTDRITQLVSMRGDCDPNDVTAYYVRTIGGGFTGCGGPQLAPGGLPAFVVADAAIPTTFAHEVGHALIGVPHSADTTNLMFPNQGLITAEPPRLTEAQCATANSSPAIYQCQPEEPPMEPPTDEEMDQDTDQDTDRDSFMDRARRPSLLQKPTLAELTQLLLNAEESLDQVVALGPSVVPLLAQLLASSPNRTVRARAAGALARLGGDAAIQALRRALQDPDPVVRVIAADGLRRLGGSVAEMALIGALRDRDSGVRQVVMHSLGAFASRAARNAVAEARRRR
jgi:hypothetical protein